MHPANVVNMSEPVKKASGIIAILGDMLIQPISWWRTIFGDYVVQKLAEYVYNKNISMGSLPPLCHLIWIEMISQVENRRSIRQWIC